MRLHAITFDLGDTLVDLGEGREDYAARVVGRAGRVYDALAKPRTSLAADAPLGDREAFSVALAHESEARYQVALARQEGIDIYDVLRAFFAERGLPSDDDLVRLAGDAYCRGAGSHTPLRPGALELLTELYARGLCLGVISNTLQPAHYMDEALRRRGIAEFFSVTVYSSAVRVAKPHPAIFRAALAGLGVPPERSLHVGDRLVADVAGAQGAGMKAVLVEVSRRDKDHPEIVPDARITDLLELLNVLPTLFD
jgi:putative hydrolase of the HAD superfamily